MKIIKNVFLVIITVLFLACNGDDYGGKVPNPKETQIKVIGRGTAIAQSKTIVHPKTGEILQPDCFLMDLIDPDTGEVIGTLKIA